MPIGSATDAPTTATICAGPAGFQHKIGGGVAFERKVDYLKLVRYDPSH
jgi:hypothetical protein